jgi:hypothetical protein
MYEYGYVCVLCVLCVVALFPVVEGPCKRYAMALHVCQATTASQGSRQSDSPEGDHMNKTKRFHRWMAVQVGPTQSCMYDHMHICMYDCMYVCMIVCVTVCVFVCVCVSFAWDICHDELLFMSSGMEHCVEV